MKKTIHDKITDLDARLRRATSRWHKYRAKNDYRSADIQRDALDHLLDDRLVLMRERDRAVPGEVKK